MEKSWSQFTVPCDYQTQDIINFVKAWRKLVKAENLYNTLFVLMLCSLYTHIHIHDFFVDMLICICIYIYSPVLNYPPSLRLFCKIMENFSTFIFHPNPLPIRKIDRFTYPYPSILFATVSSVLWKDEIILDVSSL